MLRYFYARIRTRFFKLRLITLALTAFALASVAPITSATAAKLIDAPAKIFVAKGKTRTVNMGNEIEEMVIGDPDIASVTPLSSSSFFVRGNKIGTTSIALFDRNKNSIGNLDVEITVDLAQVSGVIKESVAGANIKVRAANGGILLSGTAHDAVAAEKAKEIAQQFAGDSGVINSIKVSGSQQVQLNVRFIEINRKAVKDLGTKISGLYSTGSGGLSLNSVNPNPAFATGSGGSIIGGLMSGGFSIDVAIKALESRGVARRLAEPNLIARSGETASFLAGGEFPIPVSEENGKIVVSYKKYGVGLEFTPTVMQDGLISLEIAPEVSSIDPTASYRIGDIAVPGFSVRRAKSSIDLKSGQSFMVAGLLLHENNMVTERVPGIGNLPVIGALFSSKSYQRKETELVIIVTPHIVKPIDPLKQVTTPYDMASAATDVEFFLGNKEEVSRNNNSAIRTSYSDSLSNQKRVAYKPTSGHYLDIN